MAKITRETTRHYVVFPGEFLWISIPKVASSSMRRAWGREPKPVAVEWEELTEDDHKLRTVAFVRHPLDRMLSGLSDVFGRTEPRKIEQHVDNMLRLKPERINMHVRPQWCFVKKDPTFLGRFETLQKDWDELMAKDPKMKPLPFLRRSEHLHWKSLSDSLVEKAREVYKGDFEKFGY